MGSAKPKQYGVLAEVARAAGVSQGTVSKVVHGKRDIGPATRERIEALLDEYGYVRPDAAPERKRVYVVFRDLDSPYTHEIARSMVDACLAADLEAVVGTIARRSIARWLDVSTEPGAVGMVLVISMMSDADQQRVRDLHVPLVLIDPLSEPLEGVTSLGVTNWQGGHDAVKHLVDLGHRRIGAVSGRPNSPAGSARLHGYRAALHEAEIEYDPHIVRMTDFDYDEGVAASLELLGLDPRPTAIFATSDSQALGALEAARRLRIAVPAELSVVSFDDTSAAATASPPLTAIRQPYDEMGMVAVRALLELLEGRPVPDRLEVATTLSVRDSTGSLPDAEHPFTLVAADALLSGLAPSAEDFIPSHRHRSGAP